MPALALTSADVMQKGVDPRRLHIRVGGQIVAHAEQRRRVAALGGTYLFELQQRIDAGRLHVRVVRQIVAGAEQRTRVEP